MSTNEEVAIKQIKFKLVAKKLVIMLIREIELLQKLTKLKNNDFTIRLIDVFINDEAYDDMAALAEIYIVTDYVPYNLNELLNMDFLNFGEDNAI